MSVRNDPNREPFDDTDDNGITTFEEAWNQFRLNDSSSFVDIPPFAVLALMLVMFIIHIPASSCILKLKLNSTSFSTLVSLGFYTLISPPLHYDWQFFYRQSDEKDSILLCWKRLKYNIECWMGKSVILFYQQVKDSFPSPCSHCDNGTSRILHSFASHQNSNLQGI